MAHRSAADPSAAGFDPARLQRVADYARAFVDDGLMAGTDVLVARRGRLALRSTAGLADREAGVAVGEDTLWRIFSMTKPITSVAVMQLAEEGRVRLRDHLAGFIPAFSDVRVFAGGTADDPETVPADRPITIADLLTHTAGLSYGIVNQHPVDEMYRRDGLIGARSEGTLERVVDAIAGLPLRHQPGTRWSYSMATDVLGRVVEVVDGQPLAEALRRRILEPLGMVDTGFSVPDENLHRFAACYQPAPGTLAPVLFDPPATSTFREPAWSSGGGGLVSSMADYHRFCRMLLAGGALDGQRILGPRTVALMMRNHLPEGADLTEVGDPLYHQGFFDGCGFGLGFAVVLDAAHGRIHATEGEASWGGMASTAFWVDPAEDLHCVFLAQLVPSSTHIRLRWDLRSLVNQAIVE